MAGPRDELPISLERAEPVVETFVHAGCEVSVSRTHCVDKMGPNADGFFEFYYEYDFYKFTHGPETLHARSYTYEPETASFTAIELDGQGGVLVKADLRKPLARAAQEYFRRAGKTNLQWLDRDNEVNGYSPIP